MIQLIQRLAYTFILIAIHYAGYAQNEITPGALWLDTDGKYINAHGGGVLKHEGIYYWYGEHKGDKNNAYVGITCYSSMDLVHWKNEGVALPVSSDPDSEITSGSVMERPKVVYNQKTQKFIMWFHLELKGQGYSAARTALAISDKPSGPFIYQQSFRPNAGQWPINFKENWKSSKPGEDSLKWWSDDWYQAVREGLYVRRDFEKGQMSRDMTIYVDEDGTAYHVHAAEENLTIHISELTDDYQNFTGRYVTVAPAGHNEAPAIFKRKGYYYMITSGCTGWDPNAARSFRAQSMFGPWEPLGNPCIGDQADLTFESQGTFILPMPGKRNEFIFMADRWRPENPKDGRYVWLPLKVEGGKPVLQWYDEWEINENK